MDLDRNMAPQLSEVLAAGILGILTGILFVVFAKKRRDTSVHALDWLMGIFGTVMLLAIFQILYLYFPNMGIFVASDVPRSKDIITILNLIILLILYAMAESFLTDKPNPIRLILLSVGVTLFFSTAFFYNSTGRSILTSDIIPAAQDTLFDSFIFDLLQVGILVMILYVFTLQYILSDEPTIRKYLLILLLAIILYFVTAVIELLEHFIDIGDPSAFIAAIPTFLILAYFYLRNPNFVYLAPANIAFLQIVSKDGQLIYAAELTEELNTTDFLVGPSLTSVGSIISELVDKETKNIELKQFVYSGGHILFEQIGDLKAILQTDRPSQIIKRSMRYFLREFHKYFSDQLENYKGYIEENEGVSPDLLFLTAIPIVQSKAMTSNFS